MHTLHRIIVPLLNAFFVTSVLLYLMFYLVRIDQPSLSAGPGYTIVGFTNGPEEPDVMTIVQPRKMNFQKTYPKYQTYQL
ncbi:MAG: hypothetical protein ACI9WC_000469 [Arenicella sp.]|jgi:hypothetical protein